MDSIQSLTLIEALSHYVGSLRAKASQTEAQRHLVRFVQWIGTDRLLKEIQPSEIGEYGDHVLSTGVQSTTRIQSVRKFLNYLQKKELVETNLSQHIRVRSKKKNVKDGARLSGEVVEITQRGYKDLVKELEKNKAERLPISEEIRRAAADKDVRENAPLEAAREQLGHIESRIRQLEDTLKVAKVVDGRKTRSKMATLGSTVTIQDMNTNKKDEYMIVGSMEAAPLEKRISDVSPVGKAVLNHSAGQEVRVDTPRGPVDYKIIKVKA